MATYQVSLDSDRQRVMLRHLGRLTTDDCLRMAEEVRERVRRLAGHPFTVLVLAQEGKALPPEGRRVMEELQQWCRRTGMTRSAVVILDPAMLYQYRRMGRLTGIGATEGYFATQEDAEAFLEG